MLLQRRQSEREKIGQIQVTGTIGSTWPNVLQLLNKDKKSLADLKLASQFFHMFRIKNMQAMKDFLEALKVHQIPQGTLVENCRVNSSKKLWFIVQGQVELKNSTQRPIVMQLDSSDTLQLQKLMTFGFGSCEQMNHWDSFMAKTLTSCLLLSLDTSKYMKLQLTDNAIEETQKKKFICQCLDILDSFSSVRNLLKKFQSKTHAKGQIQEHYILLRKGLVRMSKKTTTQGRQMHITTAILSQGSTLNDQNFFKGEPNYLSAEAQTNIQILCINRQDLSKFYTEIPDLQTKLMTLAELKSANRHKVIDFFQRARGKQEDVRIPQHYYIPSLYKPISKSVHRYRSQPIQCQFMGPMRYQYIVNSEEKVWLPLNDEKRTYNKLMKTKLKAEDLSRMMKEQKINKIMVKQLINKRIKGLQNKDIKIELKPTIFQQKPTKQLIQDITIEAQQTEFYETDGFTKTPQKQLVNKSQQMYSPLGNSDTGLINHMSKNLLDYKKNVLRLKSQKVMAVRKDGSKHDLSGIIRQKMRPKIVYDYVRKQRDSFQCRLNSRSQTFVLSYSKSGKTLRKIVQKHSPIPNQ